MKLTSLDQNQIMANRWVPFDRGCDEHNHANTGRRIHSPDWFI